MKNSIVYSAITTPDGTLLHSKHQHDFVCHVDANGSKYCLDGGTGDIVGMTGPYDCKRKTLTCFDPISEVRELATWGALINAPNASSTSNKVRVWVLIKDISDEHLDALCSYEAAKDAFRIVFIKEKQYRNLTRENNLKVKFNGGKGAILCDTCNTIIKTGDRMSVDEISFLMGNIKYLPAQTCNKCL